jgi:peptide/nickel transport system permease protein
LFRYFIKRILSVIPVFVVVAFISFSLVSIYPGDYFTPWMVGAAMAGYDPVAVHTALRIQAGIDKPFIVQWWIWLTGVVFHGDFGTSFSGAPLRGFLFSGRSGLHWTLIITSCSMFLAWLFGVPLGVFCALRHRKPLDTIIMGISYLCLSFPGYFLAAIFFWIMYRFINPLLISSGVWGLVSYKLVREPMSLLKFGSYVAHLSPAFVIVGAPMFASIVRYMKINMMDVLRVPYLQTARSKGASEFRVIAKHAIRNAFNPLVSLFGIMLPTLITGSIIAAKTLGLPSFGMIFIDAIKSQDQHVLTAALLFYSSILIVGNLFADLALALLDPRIRYD